MIRLFVALIIPSEIRNQIIQIRKQIYPDDNNFRWEDDSKIHLTLKFIGEVKGNIAEQISNDLSFLENYSQINCSTEKFGFFFKQKDEPRILWLGLKTDDVIFSIVDELNQRLAKYSIPIEKRKFKVHLTLLRIKNRVPKDFIDKFLRFDFPRINFQADELALMESKLSSQGSTYKGIKNYKLK